MLARLNYQHLFYFWTVIREGSIVKAAVKLSLAHQTISGQLHTLEDSLGERLLTKQGRRLVLTDAGRVVFEYAEEIFSLGRELIDTIQGRKIGQPKRLVVGVGRGHASAAETEGDVIPRREVCEKGVILEYDTTTSLLCGDEGFSGGIVEYDAAEHDSARTKPL